jgi:2-polyprenyl-3-methyl-5-hydroxy-6-metoxy-1,4-benzoquinol methylase
MVKKKTKDPVNQSVIDINHKVGFERFGFMSSQLWYDDPRAATFVLSRYKFVSKMLEGKEKVAEIGCGDGFWSRVVQQTVGDLTITDFDPLFIEDIDKRNSKKWSVKSHVHDALSGPLDNKYDAIYSLDVLEHIENCNEYIFIKNIVDSLNSNGVCVIGMPSLESQEYASILSKQGHINCKNGNDLKKTMELFFENVFIFSMNDEVVHTGFFPMAHYLFALCCNPK